MEYGDMYNENVNRGGDKKEGENEEEKQNEKDNENMDSEDLKKRERKRI